MNSKEMKEIRCRNERNLVHYILQPSHIFIRVKAFVFMLVPGGLQFLITSTCFAWRPVSSMSKSHVLRACARVNCNINDGFLFINKRLLTSCDTSIYAIIVVMSHCIGKPTKCLGENKGADQMCSNCTADQRLCFRYTDSTICLFLQSNITSF